MRGAMRSRLSGAHLLVVEAGRDAREGGADGEGGAGSSSCDGAEHGRADCGEHCGARRVASGQRRRWSGRSALSQVASRPLVSLPTCTFPSTLHVYAHTALVTGTRTHSSRLVLLSRAPAACSPLSPPASHPQLFLPLSRLSGPVWPLTSTAFDPHSHTPRGRPLLPPSRAVLATRRSGDPLWPPGAGSFARACTRIRSEERSAMVSLLNGRGCSPRRGARIRPVPYWRRHFSFLSSAPLPLSCSGTALAVRRYNACCHPCRAPLAFS